MSRTNRRVELDHPRRFQIALKIDAPPDRVWEVMTAVELWPEWTESVDEVQRLDTGPLRIGSRVRIKQPKFLAAVWEVTALDPSRSFTWVMRRPGIVASANHRVQRSGQGSHVELSVTYSGFLGTILARVFAQITDRYLMMEAAGLRQRSEIFVR
ncbi:MAG: SRPBCC family protein [Gemmatimonadaceae bacterium]